ncbi:MAG: hypothetical protein IPP64_11960 [Bacteroidetes bacterium]|nr:hypothetical protein [Bacteroidota bacterium]
MKLHLIKSMLIFLLIFFWQISKGETEDPPKKIGRDYYEKIKVDLKNGVIEGFQTLPFDVPFVFYGAVDSEIVSITVYYKQASSRYTQKIHKMYLSVIVMRI